MHSDLIVTDSGGVQKEAYFHNKHCVTLREETEWVELVENKFNVLVGHDVELIKKSLNTKYQSDISVDIYGTGNTATQILNVMVQYEN